MLRIPLFKDPGIGFHHGHKDARRLEYQLRLLPLLIPVVFGAKGIYADESWVEL